MSTGTTPNLTKLALLDLQFGPTYDPQKMQQLLQAQVTSDTTVNALMEQIQVLQSQINANSGQTAKHLLATETGLGPEHTVSGLIAGQALVATSPTSAEFAALALTQLGDVNPGSFNDPQNGQTLQWLNGYIELADAGTVDLSQSFLTLNNESPSLAQSRKLVAGANVTLSTATPGQLVISAAAGEEGNGNLDGGFANSVYLISQNVDGGFANAVFSGPPIDGGGA